MNRRFLLLRMARVAGAATAVAALLAIVPAQALAQSGKRVVAAANDAAARALEEPMQSATPSGDRPRSHVGVRV